MNLFISLFGLLLCGLSCESVKTLEADKRPLKKIVARAGTNLTLPCDALNEKSISRIEKLTWKLSQTIIVKYTDGKPLEHQNKRRFLNAKNFSLHLHPVQLNDRGEYTCHVNEKAASDVVDLIVHDVPEQPNRPMITSFTSRTVNLSWSMIQDPKNEQVVDFILETRIGEVGEWDQLPQIQTNSSITSYQMTELMPFTIYSFRVLAVNSLGISPPSKESYYIVTLREVPAGKPTITTAHNTSSSSIYLSWKPPPLDTIFGEFLGYRITYHARDVKPENINEIFVRDSSVESHEIHDLDTYTQYLISIHVFNPEGIGPATNIGVMTDEGVPSQPRNVTVHEVTPSSIRISWLEPEKPNGPNLIYRIYYTFLNQTLLAMPKNDPENVAKSESGIHYYTLKRLRPYTEYKIVVVAITPRYDGNASTPIFQRTDVAAPAAPILSNLACQKDGTIYVKWKRPMLYYNTIDFYIISFKASVWDFYRQFQINSSAEHIEIELKIPNLTMNEMYEVKLQAASLSIFSPNKLQISEATSPRQIALQPNCEHIEASQRKGFVHNYDFTIIATIVLSCFGFMMVVLVFVLWRKCFHSNYYYLDDPNNSQSSPNVDLEVPINIDGDIHYPVSVEDFPKHVATLHADGDIGFSKEYEIIQNESIVDEHSSEHSQHSDNKSKNRYLNIIAYDHSRVQLRKVPGQKKENDYINANFIDGYRQSRAFIGTQGPLPSTFDGFWRMIWEQRVAIIVMITNLVERGRRKCDMYWPREGTETYGVIQVKLVKEEVMSTYTVRTFTIRHTKLKKKKQFASEKYVYQYHYTNWPDHGTPDHPLPVLDFVRKSSTANPKDAGPIVVHCSAGVGRTGTYIVLDAMLKQIEHKRLLNVFGFLRHIRTQRNFLVQTEEQYIFIHDALVEAIASCNTNLTIDQIAAREMDDEYMDEQFKLITSFVPKEIHIASATKQVNQVKNRMIFPLEGSRAHLTPKPGIDGTDYTNASWLFGFRRLRDFIVTQHPLSNTIKDFWQMIMDHHVQTIVCLSTVDDVSFLQFWPNENETIETDYYRLQLSTEGDDEQYDYVIKKFKIQSIQDGTEMDVRMLYNPDWPNLSNPQCLYDFLVKMHERSDGYRNGPIVVMDRYGGAEAATLCVVSSLTHQIEYDKTANIYMFAKLYHNKRPGIWQSPNDIAMIHKILATFPPSGFELLKYTALKTEFDDSLVTATPDLYSKTPDLFSKICSNGSISNHLSNGNGNTIIVKMKNDGENGDLAAIVVTSDTMDNLMLTK